jgi:DNA-binding MarR family transcriptional regulator
MPQSSAETLKSSDRTPSKKRPKPRRPDRDVARRSAREQVDAIVAQWEAERPDLDLSPVRIYGLIAQVHIHSTAFINAALEPFGLLRGTFDVLTALRRAGTPYALTPKQIAKSLLLSAAGLTSRLDRLETMNLIARLPEPMDRRTVRVQLTAAGEALINDAIPAVFDAQRQRLDALGPERQGRLLKELSAFAVVVSTPA